MGSATPMAIRQRLIAQYEQGQSVSWLAEHFQISRGTIYSLIHRYKARGPAGLRPLYSNCGKRRPDAEDFIFRAVRCMRCWHPNWGADKIHAELLRMRPQLKLPSIRTFYRWFRWNEQTQLSSKVPEAPRQWAKHLHEGWQIDAKEKMRIAGGSKHCWLNIIDEHSGTVIDPPVFPLQGYKRSPISASTRRVNHGLQKLGDAFVDQGR